MSGSTQLQNINELPRVEVPNPPHRHAAPCAPWPWVNMDDEVDPDQLAFIGPPIPQFCDHSPGQCNRCWKRYPQSRFPNWTEGQVKKAKIYDTVHIYTGKPCICYRVDVNRSGYFTNPTRLEANRGDEDRIWNDIIHEQRPADTRVRALFIENLSGPVLQMLGTRYNIEPFFWSSSLNWIPSRFQEEVQENVGDHITITMTFLHSKPNNSLKLDPPTPKASQTIDMRRPLELGRGRPNNRLLVLDLLSVHLIRNINGSTIISYHPSSGTTTAKFLHERIRFAGQSVYWQSMFQKSHDPTFILLTFIWHAMYAWDEALEHLYNHICSLESAVIENLSLTEELHIIRAHHLHYLTILEHYRTHVAFIQETPNPAMDALGEEDRNTSERLLARECKNLLNEIKRLETELKMQERRLQNVMGLVSSMVNSTDSGNTLEMMKATLRDSTDFGFSNRLLTEYAKMKQIAYLTMVFLPASFTAAVFGMNVKEISATQDHISLSIYFAVALPLTVVTAISIASQTKVIFPQQISFIKRLVGPLLHFNRKQDPRDMAERGSSPDPPIDNDRRI